MRTEDAVTQADGIWFAFALTMLIYLALGAIAGLVLRGLARRPFDEDTDIPYGPRSDTVRKAAP
jgi:hypothetical protein